MTDTQQAAVERARIALANIERLEGRSVSILTEDMRTILAALSTPSGEPEDACPSSGGCPYCEQFGCPRPALPEDVRALVAEARGWVLIDFGSGVQNERARELVNLVYRLAAALERQAETQP